jgi:ketosteroid isomerase-like protein
METWELVARESIRDLVARYNANGDSGRFDEVVALFAPDAIMEIDGATYEGRDEIRTIFTSARSSVLEHTDHPSLRHFTATLQIDVATATTARSRCYYQVLMPQGLDHWGRYLDEFGVVAQRWYFTRRRVLTDGATPGGWAASLATG